MRPAEEEPTRTVEEEGPFRDEVTESHPGYAMASFCRAHGGSAVLFGCPIPCDTRIQLTIRRAVVKRHLHRDWFHAREELIEVEFSPSQFAELITSLNMGDGIPCTLTALNNEMVPGFPQQHPRAKIEEEFHTLMHKMKRQFDSAVADARKILDDKTKKTITHADRLVLQDAIGRVADFLTNHGTFIASQFNEAADDMATAAKAEVVATATMLAHTLGSEELAKRLRERSEELMALPAGESRE